MVRHRRNGFQKPISRDQKNTMILYPILSLAYYFLIGFLSRSTRQFLILFIPHLILLILSVSSWYAVESIDPIEIKGEATPILICWRASKVQTRYCASCRKNVEGLDHHCIWLNTCIGSKNYIPFLTLVVFGFLQTALQTIICILYLSLWCDDHTKSRISSTLPLYVYFLLVSCQCLLSGIVMLMFGSLLMFHIFLLLWARMGTYEWLLTRGDPSKGEDSFSENRKQFLANEAERYEKQKAWIESISKSPNGNPESNPSPFSVSTDAPIPATPSAGLIQHHPPIPNLETGNPRALESDTQPPTQMTLQSYRDVDESTSSNAIITNESHEEAKHSSVFRSLYLKASQVFPSSPANQPKNIGRYSSSRSTHGAERDLSPHPELSYHSIVSHQDSLHSNQDAASHHGV